MMERKGLSRRNVLTGFVTTGAGAAIAVPMLRGVAYAEQAVAAEPEVETELVIKGSPPVISDDNPFYGKAETDKTIFHDYYTDKSWVGPELEYVPYNRIRSDTAGARTEGNIIKHRPNVTVARNRREVKVDFINEPRHPHELGHWWSWVEIWDGHSDPYHVEITEPAEGEAMWGERGVDFSVFMHLPEDIAHNALRVRAYCVTHGLYTNYKAL